MTLNITVRREDGEALAYFDFAFLPLPRGNYDVPHSAARSILELARSIPLSRGAVHVSYPAIGSRRLLLNSHGKDPIMDFERTIERMNYLENEDAAANNRKALFVMPYTGEVPNDGILNYAEITTVYGLQALEARTAFYVPDDDRGFALLKLIAENQILFDVSLTVLVGVTDVVYKSEFDTVAWNLERASYTELISELSFALESKDRETKEAKTAFEIQRDRDVRSDGTVKKDMLVEDIDTDFADLENS